MSGKYAKKKKSSRGGYILVLLMVLVVLAGFWVMDFLAQRDQDQMPLPTEPEDTTTSQTEGETEGTAPETTAAPTEAENNAAFTLDQEIEIIRYGKYMGLYMEDGSDEFVTNVLMVQITNTGDQAIQYGTIRLSGESGDAVFNFTTLKPGDTMVVLEAERKEFADEDVYTEAKAENIVWFEEELSLMEDQLEIQPLDGGFNVTNISGQDITGEITIYYKDFAAGVYYGGITYVCRIPEGMKKDEIRQFMTENFTESGSEIVFVSIAP